MGTELEDKFEGVHGVGGATTRGERKEVPANESWNPSEGAGLTLAQDPGFERLKLAYAGFFTACTGMGGAIISSYSRRLRNMGFDSSLFWPRYLSLKLDGKLRDLSLRRMRSQTRCRLASFNIEE